MVKLLIPLGWFLHLSVPLWNEMGSLVMNVVLLTEMASAESVVIVEACRPGPVSGTYEYPTIGEFRAN